MVKIDLFEFRREVVHILVGISFVMFLLFVPYAEFILFITLVVGCFVSFLSTIYCVPVINDFLCVFERECNMKKFPGKGIIFFFIGSLLVLQLFPENIAIASILILTFSDPISHFVGANFGKTTLINKRKYIEGTIVGAIVGFLFASFFVNPFIAFAGAFIAMFLESVEIAMAEQTLDDNLLIPLVAGSVMKLLSLRLGIV
ncbi:MAG: hypothetical protein WCP89_00670 [archaeon]